MTEFKVSACQLITEQNQNPNYFTVINHRKMTAFGLNLNTKNMSRYKTRIKDESPFPGISRQSWTGNWLKPKQGIWSSKQYVILCFKHTAHVGNFVLYPFHPACFGNVLFFRLSLDVLQLSAESSLNKQKRHRMV